MYSLDALVKALQNPRNGLMELNALYNRHAADLPYNTEGIDFMEQDWDNLLILDSCRYDLFEEHHELPGQLERRTSRAGATNEFLKSNFAGKTMHDTVYVTANPQYFYYSDDLDAEFHDVFHVWQDQWDEELQTVPPEVLSTAGRKYSDRFPNKRLILHYNQPHGPYIGPTGRETVLGPSRPSNEWGFIEALKKNLKVELISEEIHKKAYVENLELVLESVAGLLDDLDGKTVVTADHGQMLGERAAPLPIKFYTHREGVYVDELVEVPWHTYHSGPRKEIIAEGTTTDTGEEDMQTARERLHDLGYMNQ